MIDIVSHCVANFRNSHLTGDTFPCKRVRCFQLKVCSEFLFRCGTKERPLSNSKNGSINRMSPSESRFLIAKLAKNALSPTPLDICASFLPTPFLKIHFVSLKGFKRLFPSGLCKRPPILFRSHPSSRSLPVNLNSGIFSALNSKRQGMRIRVCLR